MTMTRSQKRAAKARIATQAPRPAPEAVTIATVPADGPVRPTAHQVAHGVYAFPKGPGRKEMPVHHETHDCIARMHRAGMLTDSQEEAARAWQALKAAVRAELSINEGRSCLDIAPAGYDAGEGDPDLMRRWRYVEAKLGPRKSGAMDWSCVQGHWPGNITLLREALDAFGAL